MKKRGFTLVEILVVVVIIILITTFSLIAIESARNKTRNAIIVSSLEQVQAIGETVYNPEDGYKELSKMRPSTHDSDQDYYTLKQIRKKIEEMGSDARIRFPKDDGIGEYEEYCAYAFAVPLDNQYTVFCVDSSGNKVKAPLGDLNCDSKVLRPNCNYK
jgi:prepilin-type N-terminal cleavage/methylation domain-containing protein